jgi:hypothetical protein
VSAPKLTPGPWGWQKFGSEWCLVGQHSMRPIVLSVMVYGPGKGSLTSLVDGLLRPFDPTHPDARVIGAAADLLAALRGQTCAACGYRLGDERPGPGCVRCDPGRAAIAKAEGR